MSAPQHDNNYWSEAGFSLIELMVVMVIVGLMTGAVVVLTPPQVPSALDAARKTASTLTAIQRQSVMSGQIYGASIRGGMLDVRTRSAGEWMPVQLTEREENSFLSQASIVINGARVTNEETKNSFTPELWFLPTGEFQAFQMTANTDSGEITITATLGSTIQVSVDD